MTCYCETLVLIIKPLRKKISPQYVYDLRYFCPRLIASLLKTAFFGGLPWGRGKWYDECAACCLLSPGFIKLGLNAFFPPNKAIRTMTYDCVAKWDLQGMKEGAWAEGLEHGSMTEEVVSAFLPNGILLFPSQGATLLPAPMPTHHPANCLPWISTWIQVGRRVIEMGPTAVPVPKSLPSLLLLHPVLFTSMCSFSHCPLSLFSKTSWRNCLHPLSLHAHLSGTSQSGISCFSCSCPLVTKLISLLSGANLMDVHVIYLLPGDFGNCPQLPSWYLFLWLFWKLLMVFFHLLLGDSCEDAMLIFPFEKRLPI